MIAVSGDLFVVPESLTVTSLAEVAVGWQARRWSQ